MEKISARHLTADLYVCKASRIEDESFEKVKALLSEKGFHIVDSSAKDIGDGRFVFVIMLHEGHFAVHLYKNISYVAADLFLCDENAAPEGLLNGLRSIFKPEKFRTTYLKRGDFNVSGADMKPKVKTRLAPLRRIHNTGAKVIRLLAHRNR